VLLIALALVWGTIGVASAADVVSIHVPPGGSSPNVLPFMIGVDEGFYRDEGLDVRRVGAAMTAGIQGLIAQSFDFSMILGTTTSAIMRGAPLKIIMIFDPRPLWWLYGSKKVKSLQDLKGGKLVGVSGFGTGHDVMSRAALANHGIDPQRDVAFRVVANGAPPRKSPPCSRGPLMRPW
jgi:ABC-type nitrate/sulfonate/bicarbonate transport system substrate-binding protein